MCQCLDLRFLALRGSEIFIFERPPLTSEVQLLFCCDMWLADLEHSSFLIFFISCNCSSTSHCSHTYCISNINASSSDMTNLPTSAEKYGFISILNCWFKIFVDTALGMSKKCLKHVFAWDRWSK